LKLVFGSGVIVRVIIATALVNVLESSRAALGAVRASVFRPMVTAD
jgi:hypothetical protein